jgi:acyl-CoA reductase-like NAD-dependent aldehyde dehydrogenase
LPAGEGSNTTVSFNKGIIPTEIVPFCGMKESGIGREGSKYRIEGIPRSQISVQGQPLKK